MHESEDLSNQEQTESELEEEPGFNEEEEEELEEEYGEEELESGEPTETQEEQEYYVEPEHGIYEQRPYASSSNYQSNER